MGGEQLADQGTTVSRRGSSTTPFCLSGFVMATVGDLTTNPHRRAELAHSISSNGFDAHAIRGVPATGGVTT